MHICFFRSGSPQRRHQARHHNGGVTVVASRGDGGARAKVVVSRGELERIAAGVVWRQLRGATTPRDQRHSPAPAMTSPLGRQVTRTPRSEPEEGARVMVLRGGEWRPALDEIPEES